MCIKPRPFIYICSSCGWSKKISPQSDCLMPGDYYEKCPACHSEKLERKELTPKISIVRKILTSLLK